MASLFARRRVPEPRARDLHGAVEHLRMTLGAFYRRRRREMWLDLPDAYDQDLREIFAGPEAPSRRSAAVFLRRRTRRLLELVSVWTGEHKHVVRPLLRRLSARVRTLGLKVGAGAEEECFHQLLAYVTTLTMNYTYRGRFLIER
jgi:hypothetical protein